MLTRLRYWRNLKGYSVRELAERSGVNASTITLVENQHRQPQGRIVRKLAEALEVEVKDLYSEDTDFNELGKAERPKTVAA